MNPKYEFIGEESSGLRRIRAVRDFGDVKAGDIGGWIKRQSNLRHDGNARVYGNARVGGNAKVYGHACIT